MGKAKVRHNRTSKKGKVFPAGKGGNLPLHEGVGYAIYREIEKKKPFKVGNTITLVKADFGFPKGAKAKIIETTTSGDFAIIELPNGMKAMAIRGWHT